MIQVSILNSGKPLMVKKENREIEWPEAARTESRRRMGGFIGNLHSFPSSLDHIGQRPFW